MTTYELFVKRWETEQPSFRKVLAAVPDSGLDYRPHERSASAGGIAWQLAREQRDLIDFLVKGEAEWKSVPRPQTVAEILEFWDDATAALRDRLNSTPPEKVQSEGRLIVNGAPAWTDTIENLLWGYLFDMVHHRGQLSTYLRPMGSKVPAIYGPSADDTGS